MSFLFVEHPKWTKSHEDTKLHRWEMYRKICLLDRRVIEAQWIERLAVRLDSLAHLGSGRSGGATLALGREVPHIGWLEFGPT